jgi:hypothetical protein
LRLGLVDTKKAIEAEAPFINQAAAAEGVCLVKGKEVPR